MKLAIETPYRKLYRSENPYTFHSMPFFNWLINKPEFSNSEKVSILYLASFQNYNGKLVARNSVTLDKKMIQEKTGIKHIATFNKFYKRLLEFGIIEETALGLYWNNDMSLKRGVNGTHKHSNIRLVKIYDKQLDYLYQNNAPKTLYPVLALAPYVTAYENSVDLSIGELTFRCGYSNTRSAGRQLKLMMMENGELVFAKQSDTVFINHNLIKF